MKIITKLYISIFLTLILINFSAQAEPKIDLRIVSAEMGIFTYKEIYLLSWVEYENHIRILVAVRHLSNEVELLDVSKTLKPNETRWRVSALMFDVICDTGRYTDCYKSRRTYSPNPTEQDVKWFVSWWRWFEISKHAPEVVGKLIAYGINSLKWEELFGYKPEYKFEFKS